MGKCKYCGTTIKKGRTCQTCQNIKRRHPEFFGWVLSADLETVTIDKWTRRRLTPEEIYKAIKVEEHPEDIISIISFGCAGLFNIVTGEKLYFDCNGNLCKDYPDTFILQRSNDIDRCLYATRDYLRELRRRYTNKPCEDVYFILAWHNGNSYDLSFFHDTELYNNINWEGCCGENIHDLKILKVNSFDGIKLKVVDTLKLFCKPLAELGKEIGLDKLDGTSTYECAPVPPALPTSEQLTYCFRDIDVVGQALIKYAELDGWQEITDIPYTSTGRVRNAVHDLNTINIGANKCQTIYHMKYGNKIVDYSKSRQKAEDHKIADFSRMDYTNFYTNNSVEAINNVMMSFDGGICYYNFDQLAKVWQAVESWDFSSHYPSCMLMGDFPIWAWKFYSVDIEEPKDNCYPFDSGIRKKVYDHFYKLSEKAKSYNLITDTNGFFCCAEVVIKGLKAKEWDGQMFPYLKENSKNAMTIVTEYYGGNIVSGTYSGYLTDLGFATLTMAYDYDELIITTVATCDKGNFKQLKGFKDNLAVISNIDPIFITAIATFARDKTKYKKLEEKSKHEKGVLHPDTLYYRLLKMVAKARLNGLYGNTAQNKLNYSKIENYDEPCIIKKERWLQNNWTEYDNAAIDFKNLIRYAQSKEGVKEIKSKKCELNQRWISEYVTGYARYFLVYFATYVISNNLGTILYCDTDSIKVHWNSESKKAKFVERCNEFRMTFEENCKNNPLTLQLWDSVKELGNLDYEHTYDEFVTFGNKRYITRIGEDIDCTFAGFSRKNINIDGLAKGERGKNVVQFDVESCNGSISEFIERSGVTYHLECNAEDNRKLDKCRHNEGCVIDVCGETSGGVVLSPNKFTTTDIDVCFEDERVHELMKDKGTYVFGTLAKSAGIYPLENSYTIEKEGKQRTARMTDATKIVASM